MASKVEIINMALSNLGAEPIISLMDNTVSAKEALRKYDMIADMVMSMGAWPSVKTRAVLAQLDETPAFKYQYAFQLPNNPKCLKVLRVNESRLGDVDYSIEADKLLVNEPTISVLYIGRVTDTEKYDIFLMQAIIAKLTAAMAYKFTGQAAVTAQLIQQMNSEVRILLNQATAQGSSERLPSDTFIDARR